MMQKHLLKATLPGLLLVLGLAMLAFVGYPFIPGANEVLLGLLFGVALGNMLELPDRYREGVDLAGKEGLNLSIIFLGFGISFQHIGSLGWGMVGFLIIVVMAMLIITYVLARVFRCRTSTGWLVGFGTAICGSSAIAALAGSVTKEKEEAGIAIAVVNLLGLAGMLLMPLGLQFFEHTEAMAATLLGGTLHAVGNVAGAGYSISDPVGDLAITVKLGRVALLAPGLIFFNYLVNRSASLSQHFRLPYYIWGFILAVSVVSLLPVPTALLGGLKMTGKILLTLAMTAIGMKIGIRKLFQMGRVALGFGVVVFVLQVALVLLLVWAMGLGD